MTGQVFSQDEYNIEVFRAKVIAELIVVRNAHDPGDHEQAWGFQALNTGIERIRDLSL